MAIDPIAAVEQKQRLDLLSAQQVPTGLTEPLTGPAIPDGSFEVAGMGTPIAKALGRLLGGPDLEKARQGVQAHRGRVDDPTAAPPSPLDPEIPPSAAPGVEVPVPEAPRAPDRVPEGATIDPASRLSPEALDKRVLDQARPIRTSDVEANEALKAILEPKRTELLSDGLTDFRAIGSQGDVKIPDEGNIHALIEHTSQTYKLEVDEATRGVITHAVSQELADIIGMNPEKLMAAVMNMRDTGGVPIHQGAGLSETVMAVRDLLYTELSKLDALAEITREGGRGDLLNFRQQLEVVSNLQTNFKGIQTEIGRSLGIFRTPMDHAHPAFREINLNKMLDEFGGEGDLKALATVYLKTPVGRQRAQFTKVSKYRKFTNAAFEVWLNGLLSGPITHTKNFIAAGLTVFAEVPVHLTAATIGTARRAMGGAGGETFGEVRAMMFGQMMAMREALSAAGTSYRTGELPIAGSKLGDAVSAGDSRAPAFSAEGFEISRATAAGNLFAMGVDALGTFMTLGRIPTKALGFEDTLWKVVAQRGHLWQQAFRAAEAQGLKGASAAQFMTDFIVNPPAAAIKEGDDLARKLTLQQPLEGKLGRWVQTGARLGMMRWFIPFVKTPYNAFTFAFEHSIFAPMTKNFQETMRSGTKAQQDVALARIGLGSAGAIAVGFAAASGQITGGGPEDSGLRAALRRQPSNWQPYSVLINGTYYSYAGAEPYSTIVGLMADATELVQTGLIDQDEGDELLTGVLFALSKNMSNKTFMQGFSNFMNAITNGERYAERIVGSFTKTLPPIVGSGIVRQTAQTMDPFRRDPLELESMPRDFADLPMKIQQQNSEVLARYDSWAWINSRIGELKANIPGWSKTIPALRDFWGRKVVNEGAWGPEPMSPIYMSAGRDTEMVIDGKTYDTGVIDEEMIRLKMSHKGHPDNYAGFPMNAAERDYFQERAGRWAVLLMSKVYSDGGYQELRKSGVRQRPTTEVNKRLKLILSKPIVAARKSALNDLMNHQDLGADFRQSYNQFKRLEGKVIERSYRGNVGE